VTALHLHQGTPRFSAHAALIASARLLDRGRRQASSRAQWTRCADVEERGHVAQALLSPEGTFLASRCEVGALNSSLRFSSCAQFSNVVRVWRLREASLDLISELWHPHPVSSISWRQSQQSGFHILATLTTDGVFRLHSTLMDEPDFFTLFLTISHPYTAARPVFSVLVDAASIASTSHAESNDMVVTVFQDGSVGAVELLNLQRTPPTCFGQRPAHFHPRPSLRASAVRRLATSQTSLVQLGDTYLIYAASPSGSLSALTIPLEVCWRPDPGPSSIHTLQKRPRERILATTASRDGRRLVTITSSSVSLWQVRYLHGSPCRIDCLATSEPVKGTAAAIEADRVALIGADGQISILARKGRTLVVEQALPRPKGLKGSPTGILWVEAGVLAIWPSHLVLWQRHSWEPQLRSALDSSAHFNVPAASEPYLVMKARLAAFDGERQLAIVDEDRQLQIWDIFTSEFSSGLELSILLSAAPLRLEWLPISNAQALLLVVTATAVEVYIQQRKDYFVDTEKWQVLATLPKIAFAISDAFWLPDQSVVAVQENQLVLYPSTNAFLEAGRQPSTALPAYHPQFLEQCLLADKLSLVNAVVQRLNEKLGITSESDLRQQLVPIVASTISSREVFNIDSAHPQSLLDKLDNDTSLPLDTMERSHLRVVLQTLVEVCAQRRSLDANGMRYLTAMRTFFIHHSLQPGGPVKRDGHGPRLRYRDMLWAFFSESQELLVQDCHRALGGKMTWPEARSLGLFLWLTSHEALVSHLPSHLTFVDISRPP
jgi:WD40 repeat protein